MIPSFLLKLLPLMAPKAAPSRSEFGNGRYRIARVQRFEARNSGKAMTAKKKARKAARRARARNR